MTDTLGWRLKLGVLVPSTNTAVQPEYDAMRPPGVTNHVRGFRIPNAPTRADAEFERQLETLRATMAGAIDEDTVGEIPTGRAQAAMRRTKREVRVAARGLPRSQASRRTTLRAAAGARCRRWVLARPA